MRHSIGLVGITLLSACASRQGSTVGTPLDRPTNISYVCAPMTNLRVRLSGTTATIIVDNDGPYTLPQVTGRADYAVYSDGTHVLQVSGDNTFYGIGRRLRECSRN